MSSETYGSIQPYGDDTLENLIYMSAEGAKVNPRISQAKGQSKLY